MVAGSQQLFTNLRNHRFKSWERTCGSWTTIIKREYDDCDKALLPELLQISCERGWTIPFQSQVSNRLLLAVASCARDFAAT